MSALPVTEAAATYMRVMRNVVPCGPDICEVCHTFKSPAYSRCIPCAQQPTELDVVVPITYSEHLGQMHTALRSYKDDAPQVQHFVKPRLAAILWLFLERHETCVATSAETRRSRFDAVVTVPSSTPDRDDQRANLRWIVGTACVPVADRFTRALRATGEVPPGRQYDSRRYQATEPVEGLDVLLIDDTWTRGGHAQSAAAALKAAGARTVSLVVIGRHVQLGWEPEPGVTNREKLDALPREFSWEVCAAE